MFMYMTGNTNLLVINYARNYFITAFFGLTGITMQEIYLSFIRYLETPSYTDMSVVHQEEADFPSMTICPQSEHNAFKGDVIEVTYKVLSIFSVFMSTFSSYFSYSYSLFNLITNQYIYN